MQIEKRIVTGSDYRISYTLMIKKVKNVNMHINEKGEIIVSANAYFPKEKIDAFVLEKMDWIIKRQQIAKRKQEIFYGNGQQETLTLFGKTYSIKFISSLTSGVKLNENECLVYCQNEENVEKLVQQFIDKMCRQTFMKVVEEVYELMSKDYQLVFPSIKIRTMTSRWGSCIPAKNQITLNRKCIHYDPQFLRYVVIHEFAHLIQPNHSKQFYYVVEKYMPDYKTASQLYK